MIKINPIIKTAKGFLICFVSLKTPNSIHWRHNGPYSVSNHQPHDCLLNRLFRRRSKKTSKLRVTGLCVGNSPVTGEFPTQRASNTENVSIWWRHHVQPIWSIRYWHFSSGEVRISGGVLWILHGICGTLPKHLTGMLLLILKSYMTFLWLKQIFMACISKYTPLYYKRCYCLCMPYNPPNDYIIAWKHFRTSGFCEGNPPVTGVFLSRSVINGELWCFLCCLHEKAVG